MRWAFVDGWTIDRSGALYGIHRAPAARRVAAAREDLGAAIRAELAARLAISLDEEIRTGLLLVAWRGGCRRSRRLVMPRSAFCLPHSAGRQNDGPTLR